MISDFPKSKKQIKAKGADIFWWDKTGMRNRESKIRSYVPCGKTPVQKNKSCSGKNQYTQTITDQGKIHFMFYKETISVQKLIEFMVRIIRSNERKVFLILDNLRVHHSKAWL